MDNKRKYARFLLEGCLNLEADSKLFIIGIDLISDFISLVIDEAHKLGITDIKTLISSPKKQKELYLNNDLDTILKSPLIAKDMYNEMARNNYAFLMLSSPIPGYFNEVDSTILNAVSKYQMESIKEYREYQNKGLIKWNISAVPNELWAETLDHISLAKLWDLILEICLIKEDNPRHAWDLKIAKLNKRATYLNNLHIKSLTYTNSLGTNLEIGLPENYLFASAESHNLVNMPTEEVFTSPNRLKVNGIVYSSKVLIHNDNVIADFYLKFKDGRIIDYDAKKGKDILKGIIETDDGSHYLGEVALVDYNSPISNTGVLFKNTLYDENASCHLAIGASFAECIAGGLTKTTAELLALGLNYSHEHVDFFIGNKDLLVIAHLQNGEEVVIMKNGNFVEG